MKKLIAIAALAVTGVAFSIESQNVVGYQNADIAELTSLGIPSFAPVAGTTDINIQDLKVVGEGIPGGAVQIQTLTSGGVTDLIFFWIPAEEAEGYGMSEAGWLDMNTGMAADKIFAQGEAFVFANEFGAGAKILYSGAVLPGATIVPIPELTSVSGNMTPSAFDIQAFIVEGEGIPGGAIQMQTLTSGGATDLIFFWIPAEEAEGYGMSEAGWLDMNTGAAAEHEFLAAEGFVLSNDFGSGATLKIPSALE